MTGRTAWITRVALALGLAVLAVGCATPPSAESQADAAVGTVPDSEIAQQVRSALNSASDVPGSQLDVEVEDGVVVLTGSVECEECGGRATPGGDNTVQQSVGAIIRSVPGVRSVRFVLDP